MHQEVLNKLVSEVNLRMQYRPHHQEPAQLHMWPDICQMHRYFHGEQQQTDRKVGKHTTHTHTQIKQSLPTSQTPTKKSRNETKVSYANQETKALTLSGEVQLREVQLLPHQVQLREVADTQEVQVL